MTDGFIYEYTTVDGRRRRVQVLPDTSGREGWRIEEELTLTEWREVGREPVSDVEVEPSRTASNSQRGP